MIAHKRGIEHLDTELLEDLLTGLRIAFVGVAMRGTVLRYACWYAEAVPVSVHVYVTCMGSICATRTSSNGDRRHLITGKYVRDPDEGCVKIHTMMGQGYREV